MKIIHRLYLMMAPSLVAMLLLVALAYWGRYQETAPESVMILASIVVAAALVVSGVNARYVARRIDRLGTGASRGRHTRSNAASADSQTASRRPRDEIDEIELVVDSLSGAVESAASESERQVELFERQSREYARLLAAVADAASRQLEEVRLPLHILLENHFGELNENQEEMLGAARAAAEALDADVVSVRQLAELDLGTLSMRDDRMKPSELIDAIRPMLLATAESTGVTLEFDVEPLLPAITGDRPRLQDALVTLLRAVIMAAPRDGQVRVSIGREERSVVVRVLGSVAPARSIRLAVAQRVVQAQGGRTSEEADAFRIELSMDRVA